MRSRTGILPRSMMPRQELFAAAGKYPAMTIPEHFEQHRKVGGLSIELRPGPYGIFNDWHFFLFGSAQRLC